MIDISPFAYPAAFTPGNSGRNIVTGLPLVWSTCSANWGGMPIMNLTVQLTW